MRPLSRRRHPPERGAKPRSRARASARARWRSRRVRAALAGLAACLLLGGAGFPLWHGGFVHGAIDAARAAVERAALGAGLGIARIEIRGLRHADADTVQRALGATMRAPIYAFDPEAARERLLALGWVESAAVARRLPDTIHVDIRERRPFALWQHNKRLHLIDRAGAVITGERLARFGALPLVVGRGADDRAAEIVDLLSAREALAERVAAAILVSERRWSLRFDNGVEVRLPERDTSAALERLAALQARHSILDRKLRAIDLRLPDRLIVRLLEPVRADAGKRGKKT